MRRLVVAAVLAALVMSADLAVGALTAGKGTPTAIVTYVGDSNLTASMSAIAATGTFRVYGFVAVNASRPGTGIRGWACTCTNDPTFWLERMTAVNASVSSAAYVVDLGINDTAVVGTQTSLGYSNYAAKIDWLMPFFANKPVFWTNLPCKIEPADRRVGCSVTNIALGAARARWPNLTVLDWASVANPHPEWIAGSLGGIHLWPAGQQAWASLVQGALDRHFGVS